MVDTQNEFAPGGLLEAADHAATLVAITDAVGAWRAAGRPVAWIRHHCPPQEAGFQPGSWGAELSPGAGPQGDREALFTKQVFGAFTGTELGAWLAEQGVDGIQVAGFLTHMCVSTTAREGLMRDLAVAIDPAATASYDLDHPDLGPLGAAEVRRASLLELADLGVTLGPARPR